MAEQCCHLPQLLYNAVTESITAAMRKASDNILLNVTLWALFAKKWSLVQLLAQ